MMFLLTGYVVTCPTCKQEARPSYVDLDSGEPVDQRNHITCSQVSFGEYIKNLATTILVDAASIFESKLSLLNKSRIRPISPVLSAYPSERGGWHALLGPGGRFVGDMEPRTIIRIDGNGDSLKEALEMVYKLLKTDQVYVRTLR